jgi:hypothetical protein
VPDQHAGWATSTRRTNKDYEGVVIDLVERSVEEGTIRPVAPAWLVAYGVLGMLGWTNRWFNPDDATMSVDQIAAAFADTLLLGLEVPEPERPSRSN